jgi:dolichol-phosphate mannosyltransferase
MCQLAVAGSVAVMASTLRIWDGRTAGHWNAARWSQFARFAAVGAGGYLVNVSVFALIVQMITPDAHVAGTAAFLAAVANNFVWNRRWTFRAGAARSLPQAVRFLTVSVGVLALTLSALSVLAATAGLAELPAEAIATAALTPLNFVANRLWTFRVGTAHAPRAH